MTPVMHIKIVNRIKTESINATDLHSILEPAQTVCITFESQKKLESYRRMIYTINRQGEYRYRTLRDEQEMWGLVIWRMA